MCPRCSARRCNVRHPTTGRQPTVWLVCWCSAWCAEGPLAERALVFARRFAQSVQQDHFDRTFPPRRLLVEQAPPEHAGLGLGTQLGLTVARALAVSWGLPLEVPELARRVGRG